LYGRGLEQDMRLGQLLPPHFCNGYMPEQDHLCQREWLSTNIQVAQLWQRDRVTHVPVQLERHKRKSVEIGVFRRGWVTESNFRQKEALPTNHCWCHKTRVITLSCGNKIYTAHCLVLSQSMCVTDRRIDGHNYDFKNLTS